MLIHRKEHKERKERGLRTNDASPSGGDGTFRNSFSFLVFLEFFVVNSRFFADGLAARFLGY
jgi:hypothetical protein